MSGVHTKNRSGHTLVELVMAMGSATFLMGGLASTIYIASHALDGAGSAPIQTLTAAENNDDLMADLQYALSFSERTANAVTFQVPDRDGDELPETIRYSWSGTPGDPLLMEYNGGPPATLVDDVQQLDLTYLLRTMTGTGFAKGVISADDTSLVAHWKFDEGSGSVANDSTSYLNHGDLFGGPSWVAGIMGDALRFDGRNDWVQIPHNDVLTLTDELTLTAWIAGAESFSGFDTVVWKGTSVGIVNYYMDILDGDIIFGFYNNGWQEFHGPNVLSRRTWYHIATTVEPDGNNLMIRIYQDGVEVSAQQTDNTLITNTEDVTIGSSTYGEWWKGYLDDVRIYNRTLSAGEIVEVMNGTGPVRPTRARQTPTRMTLIPARSGGLCT